MSCPKDFFPRVNKQHYVPRAYLKAWLRTINGRSLLAIRKHRNKAEEKGLKGVAFDRRYYSYAKLGSCEFGLIKGLIKRCAPEDRLFLINHFMPILFFPLLLSLLRGDRQDSDLGLAGELCEWEGLDPDYRLLLRVILSDDYFRDSSKCAEECETVVINGFEPWMTKVEDLFQPCLNGLREKSLDWFREDQNSLAFLHYLCVQLWRTPKFDALLKNAPNQFSNLELKRIVKMNRFYQAYLLAKHLFATRHKYEIILLENHTRLEFITGDAPVVNLLPNVELQKIDWYYSISPNLSLLYLEKGRASSVYARFLDRMTEREVNELNRQVAHNCIAQLYASRSDVFGMGYYAGMSI